MPTYLVRLRDHDEKAPKPGLFSDNDEDDCPESEAHSTYFIGTFLERNLTNLFWAVDEQLDPCVCEYITLKPGQALFLTEDTGNEVCFHYNEQLRIAEGEGKLKWKRIPYGLDHG